MGFKRDVFFGTIGLALLALFLVIVSGCASMTEEYWQDRYAEMTADELLEAASGQFGVYDIYIDAQTGSYLVCVDGECEVISIY